MQNLGRTLPLAFLCVIVAFIGAAVWAQHAARHVSEDALAISRDAAPQIEALGSTRAHLRLLETRVLRQVAGEEAPVAEARRGLGIALGRDLALANTPEERARFGELQAAVHDFDVAAERSLEQARSGAHGVAQRTVRRELRQLADAADQLASTMVNLEAQRALVSAVAIEQDLARANRLALELNGLSAALALLAAWLAQRAMRSWQRARDEHNAEIERRADELEQFAGRVAHDILSPLSAVGLALAIVERGATGAAAQSALVRGSASLTRVRRIVDGLLGFARAGARPEPGATAEVAPTVAGLREELLPLAAQEKAQLVFEPFEPCAVSCSTGVLISLLSNLLRNALKYLGESERRTVTLRVRPGRLRVAFEVIDTGPGVPIALRERIFEPYVRGPRTGKPGIGLGLATVRRLVESHGGSFGVRATPGGGATFWFELTAADVSHAPLLLPEVEQPGARPPGRSPGDA